MKKKQINPLINKYTEIIPKAPALKYDLEKEGEYWLGQPSPLKIVDSQTTSDSTYDGSAEG